MEEIAVVVTVDLNLFSLFEFKMAKSNGHFAQSPVKTSLPEQANDVAGGVEGSDNAVVPPTPRVLMGISTDPSLNMATRRNSRKDTEDA